jgi:CRP/FNR family transcriptional regulator, cyclic AMP receptor protein
VRIPASLVLAGSSRRVPHDVVVVRQGDPSSSLFLVERGAVRLSSVTPDGREVVVAVLGAGDVFGEAAVLGEPSPVEARVVGQAFLIALDVDDMQAVFERSPATGAQLLRLLASRVHRTERALGDAMAADLGTRLARRLHDLATTHGAPVKDGVRISIPLTQDELARMVGASREAVNRSLRTLVARDLVRTTRRDFVVPDPDALVAST